MARNRSTACSTLMEMLPSVQSRGPKSESHVHGANVNNVPDGRTISSAEDLKGRYRYHTQKDLLFDLKIQGHATLPHHTSTHGLTRKAESCA